MVLHPYAQLSRLAPNFWEAFYWRKCWAQGAKDQGRAQKNLWNWPQIGLPTRFVCIFLLSKKRCTNLLHFKTSLAAVRSCSISPWFDWYRIVIGKAIVDNYLLISLKNVINLQNWKILFSKFVDKRTFFLLYW